MAGTAEQTERREGGQDRISTNRLVTIISGHGGEAVTADTVNLGPGGMFVAMEAPLMVGDRFICKIDLGEPYKPVLSGAEVRWISTARGQRGMGVRFLDIGEAADSMGGSLPTKGPECVRVRLNSVGPALDAIVVDRGEQGFVVDVSFPFLELGTTVEVGSDVSARTAAITKVEWLAEGSTGDGQMRLWLDLEPSAARKAAGKVVEETWRREIKSADDRMTAWQRPVKSIGIEQDVSASQPDDFQNQDEAESSQPSYQGELEALEDPRSRPIFIDDESVEEVVDAREEEAEASQDEEHTEDEPAEEEVERCDEELVDSFNPLRRTLERVLGAAVLARFAPLWARVATFFKNNVNGPKLRASALWTQDKLGRGWKWTASRSGPLAKRSWDGFRSLLRRRRRQARGEPSRVVRHITDRARKVAVGRGKTVAIVVFIALGVVGISVVGYGLFGSSAAEEELETNRREATEAGWTAEQWEEPEPVESNPPEPG